MIWFPVPTPLGEHQLGIGERSTTQADASSQRKPKWA
jgi:hypothetical protein